MDERQILLVTNKSLKGSSVAAAVISTLCSEWPLSMKQMHHRITKIQNIQCSLQSVFKSTKRLVEIGVLASEEKKYSINQEWLDEMIDFASKVKTNYNTPKEVL